MGKGREIGIWLGIGFKIRIIIEIRLRVGNTNVFRVKNRVWE